MKQEQIQRKGTRKPNPDTWGPPPATPAIVKTWFRNEDGR